MWKIKCPKCQVGIPIPRGKGTQSAKKQKRLRKAQQQILEIFEEKRAITEKTGLTMKDVYKISKRKIRWNKKYRDISHLLSELTGLEYLDFLEYPVANGKTIRLRDPIYYFSNEHKEGKLKWDKEGNIIGRRRRHNEIVQECPSCRLQLVFFYD